MTRTSKLFAGAFVVVFLASESLRADENDFDEATIAQLQARMAQGTLTSVELTRHYLRRIEELDQNGPELNSVIEVNPDAVARARNADQMRRGGSDGPLLGIPVLLKDNIDTGDRMQTTSGSFALAGAPAVRDSTVAAKLRAAGAVILGKTNVSEWGNFRSFYSSGGWSARGGQTHNPYAIDRSPCGSSSGSGAAVSANLTAVSIASEMDGSIVCPANANGVVGLKPTVGLVSRAGVVPLAHSHDTVGPHTRTVADAAAVLGVITSHGFDGSDPATGGVPLGQEGTGATRPAIPDDYTQFLDPNGLKGAHIGVARMGIDGASPKTAAIFDAALQAMRDAGATLSDVTFPHEADINSGGSEFTVILFELKGDLANYFATRVGVPMAGKRLADAIAFNRAHAAQEMPFFGQEIFELADMVDLTPGSSDESAYKAALKADQIFGATEGIDQLLAGPPALDAIVVATGAPAWPTDLINADPMSFHSSAVAAIVGYPIINVPMGNSFGLPVGISFIGTGFSEPKLIKLASGFEAVTHARIVPTLQATLPLDDRNGGGPAASPNRAVRRAAAPTQRHEAPQRGGL